MTHSHFRPSNMANVLACPGTVGAERSADVAKIGAAAHRGAQDFFAGSHMNPYSWSEQGDLFRAWIEGYNTAKMIGAAS